MNKHYLITQIIDSKQSTATGPRDAGRDTPSGAGREQ